MSLIGGLSEIVLSDGVATLPYDPSFVLVADAAQGIMWRVNTATGEYSTTIDDPSFKPTNSVPLGVNGIHILRDQLYFINLATNSVGNLRITAGGHAAGPVEILTDEALAVDDFALADDGTVYAAGSNTLWEVQSNGSTTELVGGLDSAVHQGITWTYHQKTSPQGSIHNLGKLTAPTPSKNACPTQRRRAACDAAAAPQKIQDLHLHKPTEVICNCTQALHKFPTIRTRPSSGVSIFVSISSTDVAPSSAVCGRLSGVTPLARRA